MQARREPSEMFKVLREKTNNLEYCIPRNYPLKAFLRSGTRQEYPSTIAFNIVWKVLADSVRKEKVIEGIQIRKDEIKLTF